MLLPRAVFALLFLPGVVAGLVPWWLHPEGGALADVSLLAFVPGLTALLWCVRDFYVSGRGTLAPWSPPRRLVQVGLYQYSRNPMYLAVLLILIGWTLAYRTTTLAAYTVIVAVFFHIRVVTYEEPTLARAFGGAFAHYRARVRRWL